MLEDMIGFGESLLHIATPKVEIERNVGVALAVEMLQVGKGSRRLQCLVDMNCGCCGLDLVEHGGQYFVVRGNEARAFFCDMRVACQYDRDWLADMPDLVECEDRLVMKRRPIIRTGNDGANVLAGDDAMNASKRPRRAGVDAPDPAMRNVAAKDLGIKHARETQIVHIFGSPRDLGATFRARKRPADLSTRHDFVHALGTCCSARRTDTRRSSRL